jgi:hypothetical protein
MSTLSAVALGVVGMTVLGLVLTIRTGEPHWLFASLPFGLLLFVIGRFAPNGYRLAADGIHVQRRMRDAVIPYRSIRAVDRVSRPLGGLTIFGSKGVFGRFGRFWNSRLGLYRLFLTNADGVVWLDTTDGWIALSPDRPDEFVARLEARLRR